MVTENRLIDVEPINSFTMELLPNPMSLGLRTWVFYASIKTFCLLRRRLSTLMCFQL